MLAVRDDQTFMLAVRVVQTSMPAMWDVQTSIPAVLDVQTYIPAVWNAYEAGTVAIVTRPCWRCDIVSHITTFLWACCVLNIFFNASIMSLIVSKILINILFA